MGRSPLECARCGSQLSPWRREQAFDYIMSLPKKSLELVRIATFQRDQERKGASSSCCADCLRKIATGKETMS